MGKISGNSHSGTVSIINTRFFCFLSVYNEISWKYL